MKSATHNRFGAAGLNRRRTRSAGRAAAGPATVVRFRLPAPRAGSPSSRISRSTVQRATGDALAVQRQPDLAGAVDAVVRPACTRPISASAARRAPPAPTAPGGRRRSRSTGRSCTPCSDSTRQIGSTPNRVLVLVDEPHERRCGRSSSAAKKADAALRISFARRSSASSALSRLISADSSLRHPRPLAGVDLGLADPLAQRLRGADAQLLRRPR